MAYILRKYKEASVIGERCSVISKNPPLPSKKHSLQNVLNRAWKSEKPPKQLLKVILVFALPFPFVLPSRWETTTNAHAIFSVSGIEVGTHLHEEILARQGKPEHDLKGHELPLRFAYEGTFWDHISAALAWVRSLLCRLSQASQGVSQCLKKDSQEGLMWRAIWRGGELFPLLSRQGQQVEGRGWEGGKQVRSLEDLLTKFTHSLEVHRAPHCCSRTKPRQTLCSCGTLFCHLNSKKFVAMGCNDLYPILWMAS